MHPDELASNGDAEPAKLGEFPARDTAKRRSLPAAKVLSLEEGDVGLLAYLQTSVVDEDQRMLKEDLFPEGKQALILRTFTSTAGIEAPLVKRSGDISIFCCTL